MSSAGEFKMPSEFRTNAAALLRMVRRRGYVAGRVDRWRVALQYASAYALMIGGDIKKTNPDQVRAWRYWRDLARALQRLAGVQ